jgi:hypothetical protein
MEGGEIRNLERSPEQIWEIVRKFGLDPLPKLAAKLPQGRLTMGRIYWERNDLATAAPGRARAQPQA